MRNVLYLYYARRSHAIILYFTRKILIWMQYIIQKNGRPTVTYRDRSSEKAIYIIQDVRKALQKELFHIEASL